MATSKKSSSTASPARRTAAPRAKDATVLLKADHKEVKQCFKEYQKLMKREADGTERQPLAERVCGLLTVHATIEEEILYPAAREVLPEDDLDLVDEAAVEHASAKDLIAQIQSMDPDDDLYDAKVTVLGEYVDHHVKEEEEELFPKLKSAGMDTKAIGAQLMERKQELVGEMGLEA